MKKISAVTTKAGVKLVLHQEGHATEILLQDSRSRRPLMYISLVPGICVNRPTHASMENMCLPMRKYGN